MKRLLGVAVALAVAFFAGVLVGQGGEGDGRGSADPTPRARTEAETEAPTDEPAEIPASAQERVRSAGYCPTDEAQFGPGPELSVLIGEAFAGASGHYQQAFFFVGDEFVGTDAQEGSQGIELLWGGGDTIALGYTLWKPDDGHCCPTGGSTVVRFEWDGERINRLDEMPPSSSEGASVPARYGGFKPDENEVREPPCTY